MEMAQCVYKSFSVCVQCIVNLFYYVCPDETLATVYTSRGFNICYVVRQRSLKRVFLCVCSAFYFAYEKKHINKVALQAPAGCYFIQTRWKSASSQYLMDAAVLRMEGSVQWMHTKCFLSTVCLQNLMKGAVSSFHLHRQKDDKMQR